MSEKRRLIYSNDDREQERERKEKPISREGEEVNGMTGLIAKEEREGQLSATFSCFRSIQIEQSLSIVIK